MTFDHWYVAGTGFVVGFFVACILFFVAGWLRQVGGSPAYDYDAEIWDDIPPTPPMRRR